MAEEYITQSQPGPLRARNASTIEIIRNMKEVSNYDTEKEAGGR
jgi:hypothetical protein